MTDVLYCVVVSQDAKSERVTPPTPEVEDEPPPPVATRPDKTKSIVSRQGHSDMLKLHSYNNTQYSQHMILIITVITIHSIHNTYDTYWLGIKLLLWVVFVTDLCD